jgi:hypothetical protein
MFAWHSLHHHVSLSTTPSSLPLPPSHPYKNTYNTMDDSTMPDRDSSPLFMPQDEPEDNASPPKRGGKSNNGNGNGDGMDTDMTDVNSDHDTSGSQLNPQEPYGQGAESMALWNGINDQTATIPGVNTEPDAMDEQPPGPPRPVNTFTPINAPKPAPRSFSPLISKAERKRRRLERKGAAAAALAAANGPSNQDTAPAAVGASDLDTIDVAQPTNGPHNQNVARTTPATSDPDTIIAQRTTPSTRLVSPYEAEAAKTYNKPPNNTPMTNDDDEDTTAAVPRRNPATTPVNPYEDQAAKTYNKPPNHAPKPDDDDDHEDTIVVNTQPRPARPIPQPASTSKAAARKSSKRPPNKGLASSALGNSSRESVDLRQLAAKNSIEGKELSKKSKKRPDNATPNRFATPAGNNPSPSTPKPTEIAAAALKTLPGAYRQLDMLQTRLREDNARSRIATMGLLLSMIESGSLKIMRRGSRLERWLMERRLIMRRCWNS